MWFYCPFCRIEVRYGELERNSLYPPYEFWHRKCGAIVEVRND